MASESEVAQGGGLMLNHETDDANILGSWGGHEFNDQAGANNASTDDNKGDSDLDLDLMPVISDILPPPKPGGIPTLASQAPRASPSTSRIAVIIRSSPASSQSQTPNFMTVNQDPPTYSIQRAIEDETLGSVRTVAERMSGSTSKRGRPKGWQPGMSYSNMRGLPPPRDRKKDKQTRNEGSASQPKRLKPASSGVEPKKRGRPAKAEGLSLREIYLKSSPKYMPFGCEWHNAAGKTCPAELQNLETLRRHVFQIHGNMEPLICRWAKCGRRSSPPEFVDEDAFRRHVKKAHLIPYAWHMGDGFRNEGISILTKDSDKLPAYLFDKDGVQVLPSVKEQQVETTQGVLERKRKLREARQRAHENAPDEEDFRRQILIGDRSP